MRLIWTLYYSNKLYVLRWSYSVLNSFFLPHVLVVRAKSSTFGCIYSSVDAMTWHHSIEPLLTMVNNHLRCFFLPTVVWKADLALHFFFIFYFSNWSSSGNALMEQRWLQSSATTVASPSIPKPRHYIIPIDTNVPKIALPTWKPLFRFSVEQGVIWGKGRRWHLQSIWYCIGGLLTFLWIIGLSLRGRGIQIDPWR